MIEETNWVEVTSHDTLSDLEQLPDDRRSRIGPMSRLAARLDKKGVYLVCGRVECGARFALVTKIASDGTPVPAGMGQEDHDLSQKWGWIQFLPGWAPQGDTWRLSGYARRRLRHGRSPKLRRYPSDLGAIPNDALPREFGGLPVNVICPVCGFANAVRPEDVGVGRVLLIVAGRASACPWSLEGLCIWSPEPYNNLGN